MKQIPYLKRFILATLLSIFSIFNLKAQSSPFKTYFAKFIVSGKGYVIPSESTFTFTPERIYVTRNGVDKYWDCVYKGTRYDEPEKGKRVYFHIFFLINKKIYIEVSDYQVVKYKDLFYYRIVFDGQKQLAL